MGVGRTTVANNKEPISFSNFIFLGIPSSRPKFGGLFFSYSYQINGFLGWFRKESSEAQDHTCCEWMVCLLQ